MNVTVQLGEESPLFQLPAADVRSRWLGANSRVECFGAPQSVLFQARSFRRSRRIILVAGVRGEERQPLLDFADHLPDLPPAEVNSALTDAEARHARGLGMAASALSCQVLSLRGKRLDWASIGPGNLVMQRSPTLWKPGGLMPLRGNHDSKTALGQGSRRLRRGDMLLAWVGTGVRDETLARLTAEAPESHADMFLSLRAQGCLATIRMV